MQKKIIKTLTGLIPLFIAITLLSGLIYVTVQQNYRLNANDPQIQMAEDAAAQLDHGADTSGLNSSQKVDLNKGLSPFYIIYNRDGKVIASNADLDDKAPTLPTGVLSSIGNSGEKNISSLKKQIQNKLTFNTQRGSNESRLSWEPKKGVRIAAVIVKYGNGYVLAGRSLREVEEREENLMHTVFIAWIVTLGATFASAFFIQSKKG